MRKQKMSERVFRCECCNNVQIAYKSQCHFTTKGHKKHMWCYKCREITAHIQQAKWQY